MVDEQNKVNFYDGLLRVVDPDGKEYAKFPARQYREYVAEHVEPWSYVKFCYPEAAGLARVSRKGRRAASIRWRRWPG
jgi:F420-non-reducing hydrogenase large subunit